MQLIDQFNRKVDYIRVSVTDRCDFRCVYCMSEKMTFLPKSTVLSLEEIERLIRVFSDPEIKDEFKSLSLKSVELSIKYIFVFI